MPSGGASSAVAARLQSRLEPGHPARPPAAPGRCWGADPMLRSAAGGRAACRRGHGLHDALQDGSSGHGHGSWGRALWHSEASPPSAAGGQKFPPVRVACLPTLLRGASAPAARWRIGMHPPPPLLRLGGIQTGGMRRSRSSSGLAGGSTASHERLAGRGLVCARGAPGPSLGSSEFPLEAQASSAELLAQALWGGALAAPGAAGISAMGQPGEKGSGTSGFEPPESLSQHLQMHSEFWQQHNLRQGGLGTSAELEASCEGGPSAQQQQQQKQLVQEGGAAALGSEEVEPSTAIAESELVGLALDAAATRQQEALERLVQEFSGGTGGTVNGAPVQLPSEAASTVEEACPSPGEDAEPLVAAAAPAVRHGRPDSEEGQQGMAGRDRDSGTGGGPAEGLAHEQKRDGESARAGMEIHVEPVPPVESAGAPQGSQLERASLPQGPDVPSPPVERIDEAEEAQQEEAQDQSLSADPEQQESGGEGEEAGVVHALEEQAYTSEKGAAGQQQNLREDCERPDGTNTIIIISSSSSSSSSSLAGSRAEAVSSAELADGAALNEGSPREAAAQPVETPEQPLPIGVVDAKDVGGDTLLFQFGPSEEELVMMALAKQREAEKLKAASALERFVDGDESSLSDAQEVKPEQPQRQLLLDVGVASVPHPMKASRGGEDAHLIEGNWIGVADGISTWAEQGVNSGLYSRELLWHCVDVIRSSWELLGLCPHPKAVIEEGHSRTDLRGSSTICLAVVEGETLKVANIGDSGFVLLRVGELVLQSARMDHKLDEPFQIGCNFGDDPSVAKVYEECVQAGDVLLVATDGLFDNVYTSEIITELRTGVLEGRDPESVAKKLAALAHKNGESDKGDTPYAELARAAGLEYEGGKREDVTVIVAYISDPKDGGS